MNLWAPCVLKLVSAVQVQVRKRRFSNVKVLKYMFHVELAGV